jgi:hypothetical protein
MDSRVAPFWNVVETVNKFRVKSDKFGVESEKDNVHKLNKINIRKSTVIVVVVDDIRIGGFCLLMLDININNLSLKKTILESEILEMSNYYDDMVIVFILSFFKQPLSI